MGLQVPMWTVAARDHVIQQMNDRSLHWPEFHKVKTSKVQHRLCYGIAYDAQQNNVFSVQPLQPLQPVAAPTPTGELGSTTAEPEPEPEPGSCLYPTRTSYNAADAADYVVQFTNSQEN